MSDWINNWSPLESGSYNWAVKLASGYDAFDVINWKQSISFEIRPKPAGWDY